MNLTRREFAFGGAAAACSLFGGRLFAAPVGWKHGGTPKLVFGVLSDTHLLSRPLAGSPHKGWLNKYLAAALEYFKVQNVDAVVHCGDFAHRGRVREMEFHADQWNRVFPGNRAPDGHEVVKLFVSGNHEFRRDCAGRRLTDEGMDVNWLRIWGEKYEPVWHKKVRGHHFFGRHWGADEKVLVEHVKALWEEARSENENMDAKPFFLLSHNLLRPETCTALNQYRNAVGFFGHWHHSAANWREIYFVKGSSFPCIQVPTCHPLGDLKLAHGKSLFKVPISGTESAGKARQGFVVRVYDDMMVIERREFGEGGSLGADWVMPLGTAGEHPFSMKELKKVIGEPQFREGAKLAVEEWTNETKGEKGITIKIPLADGNPDSRVYAHEVVVVGDGGKLQLLKAVYAAGCNLGIGHEPNGGVTTLEIPKSELPPGNTLDIAVRPFTSLGTSGKAIAALAVRSPMTSAPEPQNVPELMRTFAGSEVNGGGVRVRPHWWSKSGGVTEFWVNCSPCDAQGTFKRTDATTW